MRWLQVPAPDPREDALARAGLFHQAGAAGLAWLDAQELTEDPHDTQALLRHRVEQRDFAAWERLGSGSLDAEAPSEAYARLRLQMLRAERARVLEIRSEGSIAHEIVEDVLRTLDVEESMIDIRTARTEELRAVLTGSAQAFRPPAGCEHLDAVADRRPRVPRVRASASTVSSRDASGCTCACA